MQGTPRQAIQSRSTHLWIHQQMRNDNCQYRSPLLTDSLASLQVAQSAASAATQDERILQQVVAAFVQTGYAQLRNVKTYCHNGRVILQGRIPTAYLKQMALEVVQSLPDVKDVDNDLRVVCSL